ncbi:MAG: Stp1/IreP family PP2C-type Ser/Thr phosphatase [Vicinamibacteria bacterium]|jgi:protein phosphatase|nr:Stp1/IreP family PP2C-type Ser/Thr phosphatase [Vicinamibacteria bacterium]
MIEAVGRTDVGRRRKLNEDSFLVSQDAGLFVVCDGMGGHNAGEVASKLSVETLEAFISKSHSESEITWPYGLDVNLSFDGNRLKTAIKLANKRVFKAADSREDYTGMGTTVVAALITNDTVTVSWAGDSRCYLLREGQLTQITRDDSWVAAAHAEGILSAQEIEQHPLRNVITKAIGAKDAIEVEVREQHLQAGDVILLCSDGLHSMIDHEAILACVNPLPAQLDEAAQQLINAANNAGGKDNVSVVLARYTP